ncbi:MAG: diadenylate cyclase CdaA [Clostridiales bacterium]|nr:diadenylate cyclase CdaA [Clostridiales bacterium]
MVRPEIGILDLLDILMVAFIVYKILNWVKETRAWTLFKGLVVFFVFYAFATLLQLNTIHWILSKTLSVGIIAFVILFQPELRKALEQLGNGKIIRNMFKFEIQDEEDGDDVKTIDEIVTAAKKMASVKTGALILVERDVPLGDHIRTGIPVDGLVTSQLLINIFEHNTPLHDGAVVIKNNRVAAAACFLPLTENKVSMELGTRHRAAIGASEVSDADIIVVSEETGYISLARSGVIYRNITPDELKRMLNARKKESAHVKKKIMRWKGRRSDDEKQ